MELADRDRRNLIDSKHTPVSTRADSEKASGNYNRVILNPEASGAGGSVVQDRNNLIDSK